MSVCVQAFPSLHAVPLAFGGLEQPTPMVQTSSVQTLPSLQRALFGVPAQTPPVHTSVTVQATPSSQAVPLGLLGCVQAGAPTVPLQTSVVHALPSSVQLVPAALTVSAGQLELGGASAISWLTWAVFPVDVFAPVTPAVACDSSALSAAAVEPLEDSTWNLSVMPDGMPIGELLERPKPATSIVLATVVVIEGAELLADPPDALMGLAVSTLKYALIPPATLKDEADDAVKTYGPASAPAVPATFQYVDSARLCPLLVVLTIRVQPVGGVIVGTLEP